uniref:AAA domain-containing protein n=1 Tax=Rhabditophanes sp. KR3021 TaxID=114890 RepID=A0AC35UFC2_9BILA
MKRLAHRIIIGAAGGGISDDGAMVAYDALSTIGSASTKAGNFNEVEWEDVVGMEEAKQILTETILWSSKYQELYKACPIRLGRAVLLHGASGSGKTYLMRALIKEANLFTITVNGPELLSKYIGSSEENVRKTFQKARQNKPSLIIFDEFDGLAPKRGHDSTGVTDRVVNQLLTEMDGVEGMDGVFVVGATTRIDLIDSALLRPGRFDHKVECVFPSQVSKNDMLQLKYVIFRMK